MYEFNKKQKIILGIIISIIIISFLYYIYTKDEGISISTEKIIEENIVEEETEEENIVEESIIVHVSGAVNKEGIVELAPNSRVSDAIDKAEGLKENADTKEINLAFKLEDGMKIYIPTIGENDIENEKDLNYITSSGGIVQSQEENTETNSDQKTSQKVNINTASQTELETLPGIGPSTSAKIISYREENGKFQTIEEIKEVNGIGDVKYENIKDLISVK